MISALTFLVVFLVPLIIFFLNQGIAAKERRGIAAGIPRPKQPKEAKPPKPGRTRPARVRSRRVEYCGRAFTHFSLALLGSQESCRYCRFLEEVPQAAPEPEPGSSSEPAANEEATDEAPAEPVPFVRPAND